MKATTLIKPIFTMLIMSLLSPFRVSGQLPIVMGKQLPPTAESGTWYCNPVVVSETWYHDGTAWKLLPVGDGRPPFLHQGLVWIPVKEHHALATAKGHLIIGDASMVINNGIVFLGVANGDHFFAVNPSGDTLSYYKFTYQTRHSPLHDPGWTRVRLGDQHFDVLPQFRTSTQDILMRDLRNWGMLGADGKWIIEPIYDAPFQFKNGIAEVMYYGQKRKIDEKGEFVE